MTFETRVPERFMTAKHYAMAIGATAAMPALFLSLMIGGNSGPLFVVPLFLFSIAVPAGLAYWLWTDKTRSVWGMIWRGAVIVGSTLLLTGFVLGIVVVLDRSSTIEPHKVLIAPFAMALLAYIYGSIATLGLPWLLGIGVSLLFRDRLKT